MAVCKDGTVTLNRIPFEMEPLRENLGKRIRSAAKKTIFVDAHPDASYDRVVAVLDLARDAGAERLGLASLKTEEDFTACTPPEVEAEAVEGTEAPAG